MQEARRRLLIAGGAMVAPSTLFAQAKTPKVVRIGWVMTGSPSASKSNLEPFRQRLRELKYVEGRDLVIETAWAEGDTAKLPGLAKEIARKGADVIVTGGVSGAQAAKAATNVIPIVAAGGGDLLEAGLVTSLAKPGGNLTAVVVASTESPTKQMEIMREVIPHGRRVAVLWSGPRTAFVQRQRKELEASAAPRLELTWHTARAKSDLQPAFDAVQIFRPDYLVVMTDALNFGLRRELVGMAAKARVPAVYGFREYVDVGGLMSYGANIALCFRSAADYVDKILKGAKPGDLPVQLPPKLELAVNAGAARALELRIPPAVLARADIVVQ